MPVWLRASRRPREKGNAISDMCSREKLGRLPGVVLRFFDVCVARSVRAGTVAAAVAAVSSEPGAPVRSEALSRECGESIRVPWGK